MKKVAVFVLFVFCAAAVFAQNQEQYAGPRERISQADEVNSAFLPGISASLITSFGSSNLYPGVNFHYAISQGLTASRKAEDFGGYYETYVEIGFYKELSSTFTNDIFFTYAAGLNFSFEKFRSGVRNFLIPYFGAKVGGIYFNISGGGFFLEPIVGIVIVQLPWLNINYDLGLFLNTVNLSDHIGLHNSLIINFNL